MNDHRMDLQRHAKYSREQIGHEAMPKRKWKNGNNRSCKAFDEATNHDLQGAMRRSYKAQSQRGIFWMLASEVMIVMPWYLSMKLVGLTTTKPTFQKWKALEFVYHIWKRCNTSLLPSTKMVAHPAVISLFFFYLKTRKWDKHKTRIYERGMTVVQVVHEEYNI